MNYEDEDAAILLLLLCYPKNEADIIASPSQCVFDYQSVEEIDTGMPIIDWMTKTLATMPYFDTETLRIVFTCKSYGLATVNIAAKNGAPTVKEEFNGLEYKPIPLAVKLISIDLALWKDSATRRINDFFEAILVVLMLIPMTMGVCMLLKAVFIYVAGWEDPVI